MAKRNPAVDAYFRNATTWQSELTRLRTIMLATPLVEEVKWHSPCYTFQDHNVVIMQGFKTYCALLFVKGVLLRDPKGILVKVGQHTQVARQIRFTGHQDVVRMAPTIKAYVAEAIAVEKSGAKLPIKKTSDYPVPEEFRKKLNAHPTLMSAFNALTPGRQRAYLLYFSSAKLSKTRAERVEKYSRHILKGKGLDDR